MKLSFSLPTKSSAAKKQVQPSSSVDDRSRFVTVFDPSETLAAEPSKPVIAPLDNTNQWRTTKKMKNLVPPSDPTTDDSSTADHFVVEHIPIDNVPGDNTQYGLNLRSRTSGGEDGAGDEARSERDETGMSDEQRFRIEMENLPEDRGMNEFADVSVEDFSRAVLEGYGWKEGQGLGRNPKRDVPVIEQKRWLGTSGLGFSGDLPGPRNTEKGKNVRSDKPPLPPSTSNGVQKKRVVRVISGKHAGLMGEVLNITGKSGDKTVVLSMLNTGEKISIGVDAIAELGSIEAEKCLGKLKEPDIRNAVGRKSDRRKEKRSRDYEHGGSDGDRRVEKRSHHSSSGSSNTREKDPVNWLRRQIRVRVISKSVKGGRHYLKKGVVTDVIAPTLCDVSMDENKELLQGVDQEILETALPRRGGPVLVLYGRHKGIFGKLVEKDRDKEIAIVQDADSHQLINLRMEQIAEYVGDPGDIGY